MEKNIEIKDFIGIFDGFIPEELCNETMELYNQLEAFDLVYSRLREGFTSEEKCDTSVSISPYGCSERELGIGRIGPLMNGFKEALKIYCEKTNILNYVGENVKIDYVKIQKTLPTEGYHTWHIEKGCAKEIINRVMAFTIYLNDIHEGGETEFLLQSQRVKPQKGRIAIWPAGFPFVHRGNPPLIGEKYIVTSWLSYYNDYSDLPTFMNQIAP